MMWILGIVLVAGIKTLLCKGIALGVCLLLFWIKGKKLQFNSEQWSNFFLQMSTQTVQYYAIAIYFIASVFSSIISYFILFFIGYKHSMEIAILIFVSGFIITAYKWHTKGKDYLLKRYQEILKTIVEQRKK